MQESVYTFGNVRACSLSYSVLSQCKRYEIGSFQLSDKLDYKLGTHRTGILSVCLADEIQIIMNRAETPRMCIVVG